MNRYVELIMRCKWIVWSESTVENNAVHFSHLAPFLGPRFLVFHNLARVESY